MRIRSEQESIGGFALEKSVSICFRRKQGGYFSKKKKKKKLNK